MITHFDILLWAIALLNFVLQIEVFSKPKVKRGLLMILSNTALVIILFVMIYIGRL